MEEVLHGSGADTDGWIGLLNRLQARLSQVETLLADSALASEVFLSALRRERLDLADQVRRLEEEVACLERLTTRPDPDLEDVYALLQEELRDAEQTWSFIYAAVSANIEFARYREAIKSARERKQEIARLAQALAEQLDGFDRTGIQAPDPFWSIRALLEKADAPENNFMVWRQVRDRVLGEYHSVDEEKANASTAAVTENLDDDGYQDLPEDDFVIGEFEEGATATATPEHDRRYAWQVAPSLADLLQTLSEVANDFEPKEHHLIGAALNTRQSSVKTSYIRAFAHLLNEHGITPTPPLMRAMAKVATLVLHRDDLVVSYDNVRKAL